MLFFSNFIASADEFVSNLVLSNLTTELLKDFRNLDSKMTKRYVLVDPRVSYQIAQELLVGERHVNELLDDEIVKKLASGCDACGWMIFVGDQYNKKSKKEFKSLNQSQKIAWFRTLQMKYHIELVDKFEISRDELKELKSQGKLLFFYVLLLPGFTLHKL